MQRILRNIVVCVIGFFISYSVFLIFFRYGNKGDILVGVAMFWFYIALVVYSVVVESILFFLYSKNKLNAFVTTYSMAFIFMLFYFLAIDKQYADSIIIAITTSVFLLLQILGYYYQRKKDQ